MKDRYKGAVIEFEYGPEEPPIKVRPGCGFLQGDVTGPGVFNDEYSEKVAEWEKDLEAVDRDSAYLYARQAL